MNVVLITIDCLRPEFLGCYGYSNGKISPALDGLASEGILFSKAFAHSGSTPYSFMAMMTSTLPLSHGGPRFIALPRQPLAELLQAAGYHTCAFQTNPWLSYQGNYPRGFDEYHQFFLSSARTISLINT